jgi:hypothetical protein
VVAKQGCYWIFVVVVMGWFFLVVMFGKISKNRGRPKCVKMVHRKEKKRESGVFDVVVPGNWWDNLRAPAEILAFQKGNLINTIHCIHCIHHKNMSLVCSNERYLSYLIMK